MGRWRIGLAMAAAVVFAVVAIPGGLYWAMTAHFNPPPPAAVAHPGADPLTAQREDIGQFAKLVALDRSYSDAARREANAALVALASRNEVLGPPKLRMALMQVAALADNGHTAAYAGKGGRPNAAPIRLYDFADGVRVLRAEAPESDLLGAELTRVEGRPVAQVIDVLSTYRGGRAEARRHWAVGILNSPQILFGAGLARDPSVAAWTFRLPDGRTAERTLAGEPQADEAPRPEPPRWLSPLPLPNEGPGWRAYLPADARLPLAWRDANRAFRFAWVDQGCVAYLQLRANADVDGQSIAAFQREARRALKQRQACGLVLDLRFDGGGDYTTTAFFARDLPRLSSPAGKIAVITGVDTFSAGITTAGFVKQAGGARVSIVGEPVGDRLDFWSEGGSGCLPHEKLCLHYATGRHRYDGPCSDWRTCYWLNWLFPVRVKTLEPDEAVPLEFADYVALRDPAFEQALAVVRRPALAGVAR